MSIYLTGTYSRAEIADALDVNISDSSHFKRNVTTKLDICGYRYEYTTKSVRILNAPETDEAKMKDIMYRKLKISKQVNPIAFALFIHTFDENPMFFSMPWEEREACMKDMYDFSDTDRTLRSWTAKLMNADYMTKSKEGCCWKTRYADGEKIREPVEPDDASTQAYFKRKSELINAIPPAIGKEERNAAWTQVHQTLWEEYHTCYYYCKSFTFNAIDDEKCGCLYELYELSERIAEKHKKE